MNYVLFWYRHRTSLFLTRGGVDAKLNSIEYNHSYTRLPKLPWEFVLIKNKNHAATL